MTDEDDEDVTETRDDEERAKADAYLRTLRAYEDISLLKQ